MAAALLDRFSPRSKLVILLARQDAGRRGATALEPADLLAAIVHEDQGDLARRFAGAATSSGPILPPKPFFPAAVASELLLHLRVLLPQHEPVAESVDMPLSSGVQPILQQAAALAKQLQHNSVQPLHLLAAMLAEPDSRLAATLQQASLSHESILDALRVSQ